MSKKLKFLLITLCLIGTLTIGCTHRAKSPQYNGQVVKISTEEFAPIDSFFTDCDFVVLETTDSALLHGETIFHTSDKYIVAYSDECGFDVFDRSGKHIAGFSDFGQGPGEYTDISSYYIQDDEVVCVPYNHKSLLVYNLPSGEFSREIQLPYAYDYAAPLGDDKVALCSNYGNDSKWNFSIYDLKKQAITANYLPFGVASSIITAGYDAFAGRYADGVYGTLLFDHNLYHISADSCEVAFKYEFDTPDQIEAFDPNTADLYYDIYVPYRFKRVVKWLGKYYETPAGLHYQHFELFSQYGGIRPYLCRFNSDGTESMTILIGYKRFSEFPYLYGAPFEIKDGYYICSEEAPSLLNVEESENLDTFTKLGLQEDANPVIFFYKLK